MKSLRTPKQINMAAEDLFWEFTQGETNVLELGIAHCLGKMKIVKFATLRNRSAVIAVPVTRELVDEDDEETKKPFEVMAQSLRYLPYIMRHFQVSIQNGSVNFETGEINSIEFITREYLAVIITVR